MFLQRLGPACVAAYNAYTMCTDLPYAGFLAMDARHCAGAEMAEMMAYAASVGSARAKREAGAKGFIGNATDATAHFFGQTQGLGTMPHALIGYAGSTAARGRDVPRGLPRRPALRAGRFFRPRGHGHAGGLPALSRARRRGPARRAARHPWRPLHRGPGRRGILRRARAPHAAGDPHLPDRRGAALADRHRRDRGGDLPYARAARPRRLRPGQDHRLVRASARPSAS